MRRSAAALAAALALAGCGSTVLSDPQLRADAGRICSVTRKQTDRIPVPSTPTGGEAFLQRGVAPLSAELAALGRLRPPKAAEAEYRAAVGAVAQQLQTLDRALASLRHGSDPRQIFPGIAGRLSPFEVRANGAWTRLQIPACIER